MKNAGVIGNLLVSFFVVAKIFESKKTPETSNLFLTIFLALGYYAIAYEIKFVKDHSWSNAHMIMASIFLINTFWCPVLEPNLVLSLATVAYHLFLIKKPNSFNLIGYIIGIFVYLFKVQHIMHEHDKTFISWIKLIGCLLIIAYYIYNVKKLNEKKKNN
jgi:predicted membrane channel-forming protein YqfA (hemolysin III family)